MFLTAGWGVHIRLEIREPVRRQVSSYGAYFRPIKKGDPSAALRIFRPGSTRVVLAHLAPSSGQCVARGPGQPCGVGGRGWPDSAGRSGLYVRAVILVVRIGVGVRQAIAKIAQ